MKIRVTSEFYDKYNTSVLYKAGTVLDFGEERAKDIISKNLAEPYEQPKPAAEPEKAVETEAKEEVKETRRRKKAEQ